MSTHESSVTEIRIRASRPTQLVYVGGDCFSGPPVSAHELRNIVVSLMEHSYYAREEELAKGFFTLRNGWRVGIGGSYFSSGDRQSLRSIGSLCIRVAREVRGCADIFVEEILSGGHPCSALIASPPGFGKTTLLRDTARQLSERGWSVSIADERHEIAASHDGIPTLDIGPRTDIIDGLPKSVAIELLVRSMSPQVIITDEIGNAPDLEAVRDAALKGVAVLASIHASNADDLSTGPAASLLRDGLFSRIVILGERPGKIIEIRNTGDETESWNCV